VSYEVEIKFRAHGCDEDLERRLASLGAEAAREYDQEDTYLSHPARDFGRSGEALRVRREGTENRLTYKGPRHAGPAKTREEIELGFDAGSDAHAEMGRLWELLGFRPVAVLRKRRKAFPLIRGGRAITVSLDRAEGLGVFAEVETIAADSADLPAAQAAVLDLARELGLTEVEPRSYLRMTLEQKMSAGGPDPGGD
jgi:adenylate cyclase class 2